MLTSRAGKPGNSTGRGFSLMEMLVVLVIFGLASALVIPALGGLFKASVTDVARDLHAGLRQARGQAVLQQQPVSFWLDLNDHEYGIGSEIQGDFPQDWSLQVSVASMATRDSRAGFVFYPDGTSTGGNVLLDAEGRAFRLEVDWLTGRVTSQEQGGLP
ncbi:GspH/FimT family pseudopilin [Halopseudomonas salegens]|uniref:Type II secretion system protein H n=1 Tax=Halopseudomonas salegens TaxID=1434072 RepID=A0A1H2HW47_9GAMM|nr:GspH/FimT family pseudopilin [Halopseudomonas salegens]SDU36101.1 type II secretion system protein H (GspH) [Halopseudomonas salegens]